jgi:hypothetical protein
MTAVTEDGVDDVKVLKTGELFRRLSAAIRDVPMFDPADRAGWQRAWGQVHRYLDELAARYPRNGRPENKAGSSATT